MLRKIDGFDFCDANQANQKYNAWASSLQIVQMIGGRDGGRALEIVSTAFGFSNFYSLFDQQDTWGFSASIQLASNSNTNPIQQVDLFRFLFGSTVLLSIRLLANGRLAAVNGAGVVIVTGGTPAIVKDQWYSLQVLAHFTGSGSVEIKLDGTTVATLAGIPFSNRPDTLGFRYEVFGPPSLVMDHFVIYDGQPGDEFTGFLPDNRVTSLLATADFATVWTPSSGSTCYAMINDNTGRTGGSPDDDTTYIHPGTARQMFTFQASPCYGRIMALAINACARSTGGDAGLSVLSELQSTPNTIAGLIVAGGAPYLTRQGFAAVNPDTGGNWVDSEITGGLFGVSATATAPLRVTAVYLEKVVSLVGPYSCGSGSYSF